MNSTDAAAVNGPLNARMGDKAADPGETAGVRPPIYGFHGEVARTGEEGSPPARECDQLAKAAGERVRQQGRLDRELLSGIELAIQECGQDTSSSSS